MTSSTVALIVHSCQHGSNQGCEVNYFSHMVMSNISTKYSTAVASQSQEFHVVHNKQFAIQMYSVPQHY